MLDQPKGGRIPRERRYGVFLRPDAVTCRRLTEIVRLLSAQFGFRSAAAFPPHVTLLGSLDIKGDPAANLQDAVGRVVRDLSPFPVFNAGLRELEGSLVFDVHHLAEQSVNMKLVDLRQQLIDTVRGIASVPCDRLTAPWDAPDFYAHLSVANHELRADPSRFNEVEEFVRELAIDMPASFVARVFTLVQFDSASFADNWWEDMSWQHVQSWLLQRV